MDARTEHRNSRRSLLHFRVIDCLWRRNGHSISVEKRSVKAAKAVGYGPCSHQSLRGKGRRRSWQETALVSKCESENSEGAKGAVGKSQGREEERLTTFLPPRLDQAHPMHALNLSVR